MSIADEKAALRKNILAARRALSPAERASQSTQLAGKLFVLPSWQEAKTVGLFASAPDEVDTDAVITKSLQLGKRVVLPRVAAPGELMWHEITSLDELVPGSFDIREPRADVPIVELPDIDFLLVPGVAFDIAGNRLGCGGGFYDRVLADFTGESVALTFTCQFVESVPTDEWDQAVGRVLV